MTFLLKAQLDLGAEEKYLFDKYELKDRVVYNSDAFIQHLHAADEHREEAAKDEQELSTIAYSSLAALGHNIMGKLSLQLTLQNLLDGIQIESQDLEELLHVEGLIHQSAKYVADYLKIAVTFDSREDLNEY